MTDLLIRAGCFVAIIILGYLLRRLGLFDENSFKTLSNIVLKITLPASIVVSFSQMTIEPAMLVIGALGFAASALYMVLGIVLNLKKDRSCQAFDTLNLPGYNIGIFTLPFVQSFLGPAGVVAASLFDTGNAVVCLGGAFGVAKSLKEGRGFSFKTILKALCTSVPFMSYVIMVLLNVLHIRLPAPVLSLAEIIRSSNAFIAMLMVGVGFRIRADRSQIGSIVKIVGLRYGIAILLALCFYFLLPFELEIRQALVILAFAPISASVPAFTGELGENVGLSSAINSITIVISITAIVSLLSVMLA